MNDDYDKMITKYSVKKLFTVCDRFDLKKLYKNGDNESCNLIKEICKDRNLDPNYLDHEYTFDVLLTSFISKFRYYIIGFLFIILLFMF